MGLDMYLVSKKIFGGRWSVNDHRMEDGLPVEKIELALGYWRKHRALHNFIVHELRLRRQRRLQPGRTHRRADQ